MSLGYRHDVPGIPDPLEMKIIVMILQMDIKLMQYHHLALLFCRSTIHAVRNPSSLVRHPFEKGKTFFSIEIMSQTDTSLGQGRNRSTVYYHDRTHQCVKPSKRVSRLETVRGRGPFSGAHKNHQLAAKLVRGRNSRLIFETTLHCSSVEQRIGYAPMKTQSLLELRPRTSFAASW